jgi:hypothetical protein
VLFGFASFALAFQMCLGFHFHLDLVLELFVFVQLSQLHKSWRSILKPQDTLLVQAPV